MAWTPEQQKTIDTRGKNILVAAAAGSGKTAVLVERIKKMVTEEGVDIDSMLIVTFTNAAAAEMKEKIRKALKEKIKTQPELKPQLDRMQRAQISTFHSFALDVIHHFFYLTDLEPDFSICDDAQGTILREEALDEIIEELFATEDPGFYRLMDWYGSEKGNDSIKKVIVSLYNSLMAMPDPFGELEKWVSKLDQPEYGEYLSGHILKPMIISRLTKVLEMTEECASLLAEAGLDRLYTKFLPDVDKHQQLLDDAEAENWDLLTQHVAGIKWESIRAGKEEKDLYADVKDTISEYKKNIKKMRDDVVKVFLKEPMEVQLADIRKLAPAARDLQSVLVRFHERFHQKKAELKLVDFNDIEHDCLSILQDDAAAEFYKKKFSHVFVDEYQDTSVLQESIIERIAGERNAFMVGDIKQSIYKFRLAEPEIFQDRYTRYGKADQEDSIKIDLNMNFRSKDIILSWINDRFDGLMKGYDDAARLYPGLPICEDRFRFQPEMRILDMAGKDDLADELLRDMKKDEIEANAVCDIIQENLGRTFYDTKAEGGPCERNLTYRDMVVLMRSVSGSAQVYLEVMKSRGIPLFVDDNEGYFDTMEINVMMNLLAVIDNRYRDVPFISVLRSEIFGFSTEDLMEIRRLAPKGRYVDAFHVVAGWEPNTVEAESTESTADVIVESASTEIDPALRNRAREVLEQLDSWRQLAAVMPLPDYLWMLMRESGYYICMGAMPAGEQRQANLRALIDRTQQFRDGGQSSLYGFIRYIDNVKRKKVEVGQVRLLSEKDDVVRIMTIHKSKGLEFPLVICAGMGRKLMYTKAENKVIFHKDIGLGMFLEDPSHKIEKRTLPYNLILEQMKEEEREEQIRVLYVALTRARDLLYLTGSTDNAEKLKQKKSMGITGKTTYLDMLTELADCKIIPLEEMDVDPEGSGESDTATEAAASESGTAEEETRRFVEERLDYRYPYEEASGIRSKYSVSALNKAAHQPVVGNKDDEELGIPEAEHIPEIEDEGITRVPVELTEEGYYVEQVLPVEPELPAAGEQMDLFTSDPILEAERAVEKKSLSRPLPIPAFLQEEKKLTAAERGTVYHSIMERLDFPKVVEEGRSAVQKVMDQMLADEVLFENEAKAVRPWKVMNFFDSEIGKRCRDAAERGELYREQSFNLAMERDGEQIIVQGIIDCFFKEDGKIVLLDYKTNWIDPEKPLEQEEERIAGLYCEQLSLYARAITESLGMPVEEAYLYLFSVDREIRVELTK